MIIKRILIWAVIIFFLCIVTVPLIWVFMSTFKTNIEFNTSPVSIPHTWTIRNYIDVFIEEPLLMYLRNSIIVTVISTLLSAFIALLASYVFIYKFPFKNIFFYLCMFGIFIPFSAFMLPYFLIINWFNLYDNLLGLILVNIGMFVPTSFLIINTYMREAINREVMEAAYLDGASFHQVFSRIVTPISRGGIISSIIFLTVICWNELLYAMLLTQSENTRTAQVAIRYLTATFSANYPMSFAALIITVLPMILIYVFLNKYIVSGLTMINK